MPCPESELHASHRWTYKELYENFCAGQHTTDEGGWFVPRRGSGGTCRPHFFLTGEDRSICGYGHRSKGDWQFHPDTSIARRPCGHCIKAVR